MTNLHRGEVDITLDGKTYIARPTHEAVAHIESHLQAGIIGLANSFFSSTQGIKQVAAVLYYCIMAYQKDQGDKEMPFSFEKCEKLIYEKGVIKAAGPAVELVSTMVSGETTKESASKNESSASTDGE